MNSPLYLAVLDENFKKLIFKYMVLYSINDIKKIVSDYIYSGISKESLGKELACFDPNDIKLVLLMNIGFIYYNKDAKKLFENNQDSLRLIDNCGRNIKDNISKSDSVYQATTTYLKKNVVNIKRMDEAFDIYLHSYVINNYQDIIYKNNIINDQLLGAFNRCSKSVEKKQAIICDEYLIKHTEVFCAVKQFLINFISDSKKIVEEPTVLMALASVLLDTKIDQIDYLSREESMLLREYCGINGNAKNINYLVLDKERFMVLINALKKIAFEIYYIISHNDMINDEAFMIPCEDIINMGADCIQKYGIYVSDVIKCEQDLLRYNFLIQSDEESLKISEENYKICKRNRTLRKNKIML